MKVLCPKCGSDQIHSNQNGFSAGKALGGAIVTGGVGLLAGFIGSKKVIITCLACGNNFKAGDGKNSPVYTESEKINHNLSEINNKITIDRLISRDVNRINSESGILQAIKYVQELKCIGFNEAKEIVDVHLNTANKPIGKPQSNLGCIVFLLVFLIVAFIIIGKLKGP